MTAPAPDLPSNRLGRRVLWTLAAVVVIGVVAAVGLWPASLGERRDAAVDLCKSEVEDDKPTPGPKRWQESSFRVGGDQVITVSGVFAAGDAGLWQFSCEVEGGKVTSAEIGPSR